MNEERSIVPEVGRPETQEVVPECSPDDVVKGPLASFGKAAADAARLEECRKAARRQEAEAYRRSWNELQMDLAYMAMDRPVIGER